MYCKSRQCMMQLVVTRCYLKGGMHLTQKLQEQNKNLWFYTFNEIWINELQVILKVECQTAKQMSVEAHYISPHCNTNTNLQQKKKYKSTEQTQTQKFITNTNANCQTNVRRSTLHQPTLQIQIQIYNINTHTNLH